MAYQGKAQADHIAQTTLHTLHLTATAFKGKAAGTDRGAWLQGSALSTPQQGRCKLASSNEP